MIRFMSLFIGAFALVTLFTAQVMADDRIYTIYKTDNSWVDGYEMRKERIFGELFYILKSKENMRVVRVKADEVFRVVEDETAESGSRVEFHYKRGLEADGNGFYQVAIREFDKVLSIDPNHVLSRNKLAMLRDKVPQVETGQDTGTKTEEKAETPDEILRKVGMREDQIAFLRMVSQAHDVGEFRLVIQAVDNWIKDYKDYKISTKGADLPPLRYELIPVEKK